MFKVDGTTYCKFGNKNIKCSKWPKLYITTYENSDFDPLIYNKVYTNLH